VTPRQKIRWLVLDTLARWRMTAPPPYPCPNVDALFHAEEGSGDRYDACEEVRCSGEDTGLSAGGSRNYEATAVAKDLPDRTWVGWTYYHGGGKHSNPGEIPWMEDAYNVTVREETRVVLVFSKPDQ
jgi:hypothetical protein